MLIGCLTSNFSPCLHTPSLLAHIRPCNPDAVICFETLATLPLVAIGGCDRER